MAKLEARLEANPQCKEVINPKTGATMPCPSTEKLVSAQSNTTGTAAVPVPTVDGKIPSNSKVAPSSVSAPISTPTPTPEVTRMPVTAPCKPQVNTKTGAIMPCPNG